MSDKQYLPVAKGIEIRTGNRPSPVACWRWTVEAKGTKRLKSVMVGSRRFTTLEWIDDWITKRTEETTPDSDRTQSRLDEVLS